MPADAVVKVLIPPPVVPYINTLQVAAAATGQVIYQFGRRPKIPEAVKIVDRVTSFFKTHPVRTAACTFIEIYYRTLVFIGKPG